MSNEDRYVNKNEAGRLIGVSPRSLDRLAHEGRGPMYRKIGHLRRYRISDLYAWASSFPLCGDVSRVTQQERNKTATA